MRGAHVEHVAHVRDAGRVEAQRLVERRRALPSRKEGVRCGARCGPGAGGRGPAAAHERHAREEGLAVKAGGARACAGRTWNMPPMSVTLDVSKKLSGWLNADAPCRVERRVYDAERGVSRGRAAVEAAGTRACAERTWNMPLMSVTLDVSQLETSTSKFCKYSKR